MTIETVPRQSASAALDQRRPHGTTPLVLLHGAGASSRQWADVITGLPDWIMPVAVDLPGHGDSPGYAPGSLAEAARAVIHSVSSRGIPAPYAIAGHSFGGLVALRLALDAPADVSHLALVASAARATLHPRLLAMMCGTEKVDTGFIRAGFTDPGPADPRTAAACEIVVGDLRRTRLRSGCEYFEVGEIDLTAELHRIAIPSLVLIAAGDPVIAPRKSHATAAALPNAHSVVLTAGHHLPLECPEVVANELGAFLAAPAASGPDLSSSWSEVQ